MKRVALQLHEPSRREACAGAVACVFGLFVASCVDSGDVVETGSIHPDGEDPDGGMLTDGRPPPDGSVAAICVGSEVDVGAPSAFAMGTPVLISASQVYVVRDAGGLYALSSRCTHNNVGLNVASGRFRCPRHGALFTVDGDIVSGPVTRGLVHYALCLLGNGHVGLNRAVTVASAARLVA